jgi:hypothetical protein
MNTLDTVVLAKSSVNLGPIGTHRISLPSRATPLASRLALCWVETTQSLVIHWQLQFTQADSRPAAACLPTPILSVQ